MTCLVVDEPEYYTEEECNKEEVRNIETFCGSYSSSDERDILLLESTDRLSICKYKTDTVDDCLCAKSCNEWRNFKFSYDDTVDKTDTDTYSNDDQQY